MKDSPIPVTLCPACGELVDAALDPSGQCVPEVGDIVVCAYCYTVLSFGEDMKLIVPAYIHPDLLAEIAVVRRASQLTRKIMEAMKGTK